MSEELLMREISRLGPAERRRLIAYLVSLESGQSEAHRANMAKMIDDQDPAHWASLDDLDRLLESAQA